jgi:hypothetical protein
MASVTNVTKYLTALRNEEFVNISIFILFLFSN